MPTESTFLFAGLLFIAAALGYFFARFGDDEEDGSRDQAKRGGANLLRGFRYFLNEEPDRAVDILTEAADSSEDAVEVQLALGALFRRRGEIERAIRLHENLLERPGSGPALRELATMALAEDFLSAGLFDRAEELFLRLRESPIHGPTSLERLLRIAEVTNDWERAIDLGGRLGRSARDAIAPSRMAHYHCELAELARREGRPDDASRLLVQAGTLDPGKVRTALIRGDQAAAEGRFPELLAALAPLITADPDLCGEVLSRLFGGARTQGDRDQIGLLLASVGATPEGQRGIALALLQDASLDDPGALEFLAEFIDRRPALRGLAGPDGLDVQEPAARLASVRRIRDLLQPLLAGNLRYQCSACGYRSAVRHWHCPGCRSWDSIRPLEKSSLHALLG